VRCATPQPPPPPSTAGSSAAAARAVEYSALAATAALAASGAPQPLLTGALLALEAGYVTLHAWPLAPLARPAATRVPDAAFMATFTTPGFFASELLLLALLWSASPAVRAAVPVWALGAHAAAHGVYTAVAAFAPGWALSQNVRRVSGGASARSDAAPLLSAWDATLNVLNAADLGMHAWYAAALAGALPPQVALAVAACAGAAATAALTHGLRRDGGAAAHDAQHDACEGGAFPLRGRVAVVTGAAGGVGRCVVALLAARGARVVALARHAGDAADAAAHASHAAATARSGGSAVGVACELCYLRAVAAAARRIAAEHPGGVHLLVCNAGVARWGGPPAMTRDGYEVRERETARSTDAWPFASHLTAPCAFPLCAPAAACGFHHRSCTWA
jgi:hypothetical protein